MQIELKEDFDSVFSNYTQISQEYFSAIRSGDVLLQIIQSNENLDNFLEKLYSFTDIYFCENDLLNPICKYQLDKKVYVCNSNHTEHFQAKNTEILQLLILTEFNNVKYYCYQTNILKEVQKQKSTKITHLNCNKLSAKYGLHTSSTQKKQQDIQQQQKCSNQNQNNIINNNIHVVFDNLDNIKNNIHNKNYNNSSYQFEQDIHHTNLAKLANLISNNVKENKNIIRKPKNKTKINEQIQISGKEENPIIIDGPIDYEVHDTSISDISFHYNSDGSEAILFNLNCQEEIIKKAISGKNFESIKYDYKTQNILLEKKRNIILSDFDALQQQYDNNSLPLSTYLCTKFEESKKHLNSLGIYNINHLSKLGTIPNPRLRQDLIELYECLNKDLEFNDQHQDQYCYAYYTQSDNPLLLEGLIVGPEGTPFETIVYTLTLKVPQDYPHTPPDVYFNQNVLHPNISEKGKICLDILNDKWSPALTIQKVLVSIVSLLYEKNLDDVYNHYAKCLYIENPAELKKKILQQAIFSGCQKVDINYKEISKLSAKQQTKNTLQIYEKNEYEYKTQEPDDEEDE